MNTTINATTAAFDMAYGVAAPIEFNMKWNNGTGYMNGAVSGEDAPKLEVGQVVKAISPMPNNRRLLIVGTPLGNVVVFERYTDGANDVFVYNCTIDFGRVFNAMLSRPLSPSNIAFLVGDDAMFHPTNVGLLIERLVRYVGQFDPEKARVE